MDIVRKVGSIVVTYYSNPHEFWFKYQDDVEADEFLAQLEENIEQYVYDNIVNRRSYSHSPEIGEIVLCRYSSNCMGKWIRARVDHIINFGKDPKYFLWAIDYGFPIQSKSRWIRQLMLRKLKIVRDGLIFKGGLYGIIPSIFEFNFVRSKEEISKTTKWSSRAIQVVEDYIAQADKLSFRCEAYLKEYYFGSLIATSSSGKDISAHDILRNLGEGTYSSDFVTESAGFEHISYWECPTQNAIFKIYKNLTEPFEKNDTDKAKRFCRTDKLLSIKNVGAPTVILKDVEPDNSSQLSSLNLANIDIYKYESDQRKTIINQNAHYQTSNCEKTEMKSFKMIPMNKRLAIAEEKCKKKIHDALKPNQEGFVVDTPAVTRRIFSNEWEPVSKYTMKPKNTNSCSNDDKFMRDSENCNLKNNKFQYQKALEYEQCFTASQAKHILIHGHESILQDTIHQISYAHFTHQIHTALNFKNITEVYRIQSIGWPVIMRGSSIIVVNSARTGKTWTYLPAVCSLIIQRIEDHQIPKGNGPVSIIVCASSEEVEEIMTICKLLLDNTGVTCVKAYGFFDVEKVLANLLNGTDILITTVPCLYRLMTNQLQLFSKDRIISLVFDNIDLVYHQFEQKIVEIFNILCKSNEPIQTIVTSRTWNKILDLFYKELNGVILCIGAHIEAAVYANTEMTVQMFEHKFKEDRVLSYLMDEKYRSGLTIIICNKYDEVEQLLKKLTSTSIKVWSCHENTDSNDINIIKKEVEMNESGDLKALICTDEVLLDLDIRCATHLIHFSLPATWTLFAFRFSVFLNYHENRLTKGHLKKPTATSLVFLDENNNDELPRVIDFMKMRGLVDIPEQILKFAELKRIENEENSNLYRPFCKNLLTNGICHGYLTCQHRHIITKFDRSHDDVPRKGSVKFEIIEIHTPVHFTVRLLEHKRSPKQKWTKIQSSNEFIAFNMELTNFFSNTSNHVIHFPYNLGDLCIVGINSESGLDYRRAKIVKIEEKLTLGILKQVVIEILLIDSNMYTTCNSLELIKLPEKFRTYSHQAVDIRISGIVPHDFDCQWDSKTLQHVKNWLQHDQNNYLRGNIQLSIMNTLWVDSVDVIENLHSLNYEVKLVSIRNNLLNNKFGVMDSQAIDLILRLAKKAGLQELHGEDISLKQSNNFLSYDLERQDSCSSSLLDFDESTKDRLNRSTCTDDEVDKNNLNDSSSSTYIEMLLCESRDSWADILPDEFVTVMLCTFYHPDRLYIRNNDLTSKTRFSELIERIDEFTSISKNLKPLDDIAVAKNCLAKLNDKFNRAKILKIFHDGTVEVMFVDFGEFSTVSLREIIQIPAIFVKTLAFQAIFCKFIGIRPTNNSSFWDDSVCDDIYENFLDHPYMFVRSMQPGKPDKYTYGLKSRTHQLVCLDATYNNINDLIVSNNYGEYDPTTQHFLEVLLDKNLLNLLKQNDSEESYTSDDDCNVADDGNLNLESDADNSKNVEFDIQFDDDDIKQILDLFNISYDQANQLPPVVIEENDSLLGGDMRAIDNKPIESKENFECAKLVYTSNVPNIKWHQTDNAIVLTISAPDVVDYYLKVTPRMVQISYEKDNELFAAVLNLFGCIDIEYTSHKILGLNIVVRLLKSLIGLTWTRLLDDLDKHQWLHYNFDITTDKCDKPNNLNELTTQDSATQDQHDFELFSEYDESEDSDS